jgi:hypothetical protein
LLPGMATVESIGPVATGASHNCPGPTPGVPTVGLTWFLSQTPTYQCRRLVDSE